MDLKHLDDPSIDWDTSDMQTLTCRWHPGARYLTKDPWSRGVHFIKADPQMVREWVLRDGGTVPSDAVLEALGSTPSASMECPCDFRELRVIV